MDITAAMVKKLRDPTGAGMMECKAALTEAQRRHGRRDDDPAQTGPRARRRRRPAARPTKGMIGSYIHMGGKIGVLVEVNCESDFVARTDDFQNLAREIAMHIAAASPQYVRRDEVPADVLDRERGIYRGQMEGQNKPAAVIDKIVEGKLNSFYEQVCLLDQPSIRDPKVTIGQIVQQADREDGREHRRLRASFASSSGRPLKVQLAISETSQFPMSCANLVVGQLEHCGVSRPI